MVGGRVTSRLFCEIVASGNGTSVPRTPRVEVHRTEDNRNGIVLKDHGGREISGVLVLTTSSPNGPHLF